MGLGTHNFEADFFYLFFQIVWTLILKFFLGFTLVGCVL
jgi:hypothetical protein